MAKLNTIGLLWHFVRIENLEQQVKVALDSWNRHKDTRDIVPEVIAFSSKQVIPDEVEDAMDKFSLAVEYRQSIQPNHFQIEGMLY